jgi:hypothetical protein
VIVVMVTDACLDLNTIRKQLHAAIADGLDPTAKVTRPLVEYIQSSQEGDELFAIWDLQTQVS